MGEGIRIFSDDFANIAKGGSESASSRTTYAQYAFDNELWSKWYSESEDTNGDDIYLEKDFGASKDISVLCGWGTNISDLLFQTWDGSAWVDVTSSNATILTDSVTTYGFLKTSAGEFFLTASGQRVIVAVGAIYYYCAILNGTTSTEKIRITGSNTYPADEEKEVVLFMAFENIGQFEYRPELQLEYVPNQINSKIEGGKYQVYELGEGSKGILKFANHFNQNDIDLYTKIINFKTPFFIWKGGGNESQFKYLHEGHRFKDLYKVAYVGPRRPVLLNNRYNLALNVGLQLLEVV